jgi:enediyne biosynthesis protein E4
MTEGSRRWRSVSLLVVVAAALLWGGWKWWEVRRYRKAMAVIEEEMESGLNGLAVRNLVALLDWKPESDEALNLLGTCEMARGHHQAAAAAWDRVSPRSQFAPQAMVGRVQVQLELGRLADAEQMIIDALDDPRIDGASLGVLLATVYLPQGRMEETKRLIEARWDSLNQAGEAASESAINLVRTHIDLRGSPGDFELFRAKLDSAARLAPDDDRIWLGKANQAIRDGSYDEASRWLDACARQRPDDVAVWRTRLNWAVKTNRVAEAQQALTHLPAELSTPAQVQKLAAWFAARRGDVESEQRALERLIMADPADLVALDRLIELAVKNGRPDRASELRRAKTKIETIMARYQQLHKRHQPSRDAAEMARLAEQLGQRFEAKAFLTLAIAVDPDRVDLRRDLARLHERSDTIGGAGRTLAQLVAAELGDVRSQSGQSTHGPVKR